MRVLTVIVAVLLLGAANAAAGDGCCDNHKCGAATCCKHETAGAAPGDSAFAQVPPGTEWPEEIAEKPVREYLRVLFRDPVRIGDKYLFGSYVIEHDAERMARGLPCTHIYKADDLRLPVVAFHCRHLERKATENATVTLRRLSDPVTRVFRLVEYQFEGSADAHGVPTGR